MKGLKFLFVGLLIFGCGNSFKSNQPTDADALKFEAKDTAPSETPQDIPAEIPAGVKKLTFVTEKDDYGQSCKGSQTCNFKVTYNAERSLEVKYTINGETVGGTYISYENINDPNGVCTLTASQVATEMEGDKKGIASVIVKNKKSVVGQCQIKVSVSGETDVDPLYFNIAVLPKDVVALTVGFKYSDYKGNYKLNQAQFFLFKNTTQKTTKCANINPKDFSADIQSSKVLISQTAHFVDLPKLEQEKKQNYTVLGIAYDLNGIQKSYGCDDTNGIVEWGKQQTVWLEIIDQAPKLKGTYDVYTELDLVSGLPPDVETVINAIIGFFQSPAGEIMLLMCKLTNQSLEDLCQHLFTDPNNPALNKKTTTGEIVFNILDQILIGLLEGNCPFKDKTLCGKIYWTGNDISDMLKKLELGATFTFFNEPAKDGTFTKNYTEENWQSVTFQWSYGKDCDPKDQNCGKVIFQMWQIPDIGETVTGKFEGKVDKFFDLTINPHTLKIKYGALLNFAIQNMVLPKIFGDGTNGTYLVDTYDKMIKSLLGGNQCLGDGSCCTNFANNVTSQTTGLTFNLVKGACDALVQVGAQYLTKLLTDLDAEPDNFSISTKNVCKMADSNNDMKIDSWGKKEEKCKWDIKLKISGATYDPDGSFYAIEKQ
jgi:hypothetical protein